MGVKVIIAANLETMLPVAEVRAHCYALAADDAQLVGFRAAAHGHAEHYTQRAFGSQTLELALDEFPAGPIELLRGPVSSIASIKYIDQSGVEQTLSDTLYTLDNYGLQCWAVPAVDTDWPASMAVANAVKVRYVAGDLPGAVRSAMLLMAGHLYANRESSAPTALQELPMGVKALLDTVKVWGF